MWKDKEHFPIITAFDGFETCDCKGGPRTTVHISEKFITFYLNSNCYRITWATAVLET